MSNSEKIDEFTHSLKEYTTIQLELLKLDATERVSVIASELTTGLIVISSCLFFLFFISIGVGFYLSSILGSTYIGFLIVAGFYFVMGAILFLGRKSFVTNPVKNNIVKSIFSKN